MSATNHTTTIELSQYISTDKPTYLTDYNGDMLKIDNAIAADREAITAAQSKANTADGKADANKTSIDTLGEQINGDPLDPSDTGLAGAVSANTGSINTINSLLGNGEPTTTDKTLIGAINELDAEINTASTGIDARVTAAETAIGDLTNLTTTEKSSLVGAVNEIDADINTPSTGIDARLTAVESAVGSKVELHSATFTPTENETWASLLATIKTAFTALDASHKVFAVLAIGTERYSISDYVGKFTMNAHFGYPTSQFVNKTINIDSSAFTVTSIADDGTVTVTDGSSDPASEVTLLYL